MTIAHPGELQPGDVLLIGPAASAVVTVPFRFRLRRVLARQAPPGWCFLDGLVLDVLGDEIRRRTILVRVDGLVRDDPVTAARRAWRLANNRGHHFRAV